MERTKLPSKIAGRWARDLNFTSAELKQAKRDARASGWSSPRQSTRKIIGEPLSPEIQQEEEVSRAIHEQWQKGDVEHVFQIFGWQTESKVGRPAKDAVRKRVQQLKKEGKSWAQIALIVNRETAQNLTVNAYRNLVQRNARI